MEAVGVSDDIQQLLDGWAQDYAQHAMERVLFRLLLDETPIPMWIKRGDGVMLWNNSAYSNHYGIPRMDYFGHRDAEVWPKNTARSYDKHDVHALNSGTDEWHTFIEDVPNQKTGKIERTKVQKRRMIITDGELVLLRATAGRSLSWEVLPDG